MSREEANRLSSLRRDELRKNEELEKNKILKIRNMLRVSVFYIFNEQGTNRVKVFRFLRVLILFCI